MTFCKLHFGAPGKLVIGDLPDVHDRRARQVAGGQPCVTRRRLRPSPRPLPSPARSAPQAPAAPWGRPSSESFSVFGAEDRKDVARSRKSVSASRDSLGSVRSSDRPDSGDVIHAATRCRPRCESTTSRTGCSRSGHHLRNVTRCQGMEAAAHCDFRAGCNVGFRLTSCATSGPAARKRPSCRETCMA